jgi:hypothetical protein
MTAPITKLVSASRLVIGAVAYLIHHRVGWYDDQPFSMTQIMGASSSPSKH